MPITRSTWRTALLVFGPVLTLAVIGAVAFGLSGPQRATEPATEAYADRPDVSGAALVEMRERAGIEPCPQSDPAVAARADGLPDIELLCLDHSGPVRLAGLRGKPMIVNVWATWCGPCRQEAPHLAAYARARGEHVQLLGIDVNDPDPAGALRFAEASGWTWPQLADRGTLIAARYGPAIPQTLFVTADGRVAYRHFGAFESFEQLDALAAQHLGVD